MIKSKKTALQCSPSVFDEVEFITKPNSFVLGFTYLTREGISSLIITGTNLFVFDCRIFSISLSNNPSFHAVYFPAPVLSPSLLSSAPSEPSLLSSSSTILGIGRDFGAVVISSASLLSLTVVSSLLSLIPETPTSLNALATLTGLPTKLVSLSEGA